MSSSNNNNIPVSCADVLEQQQQPSTAGQADVFADDAPPSYHAGARTHAEDKHGQSLNELKADGDGQSEHDRRVPGTTTTTTTAGGSSDMSEAHDLAGLHRVFEDATLIDRQAAMRNIAAGRGAASLKVDTEIAIGAALGASDPVAPSVPSLAGKKQTIFRCTPGGPPAHIGRLQEALKAILGDLEDELKKINKDKSWFDKKRKTILQFDRCYHCVTLGDFLAKLKADHGFSYSVARPSSIYDVTHIIKNPELCPNWSYSEKPVTIFGEKHRIIYYTPGGQHPLQKLEQAVKAILGDLELELKKITKDKSWFDKKRKTILQFDRCYQFVTLKDFLTKLKADHGFDYSVAGSRICDVRAIIESAELCPNWSFSGKPVMVNGQHESTIYYSPDGREPQLRTVNQRFKRGREDPEQSLLPAADLAPGRNRDQGAGAPGGGFPPARGSQNGRF